MSEVADHLSGATDDLDLNLTKLRELARRIPSRTVKVEWSDELHSDIRYRIYVDNLPVKGGWWTYDQAWCILVGMRAV